MEKQFTIMVVEDDTNINNLLKTALEKARYKVLQAFSGTEAELILQMNESIALVLLDLMLPGISGEEVLKHIREKGNLPVIVLTARDSLDEKIGMLTQGADDYITKPFDPSQLVARVRAHLKRYERLTAGHRNEIRKKENTEQIQIQNLVIEPKTWKVWKEGKEIKLPNREFELLRFLAEHPNLVFSKEQLFETIWGYDYVSDAATVAVHINRLREKIEDDARNPKIIETVWGVGYRLNS